ncbi:MAG: hypothetical protein M1838_002467 [Thelocarpon superellum]|nr:MAG: hypothetical protein M1838_002467 [Thelocarpon superellum]
MPVPLAKGLIIAASILIAAGVAVYENPQVREWVDQSRRKLALALHNLGDEILPSSSTEEDEAAATDAARKRREDIMARNHEQLRREDSTVKKREPFPRPPHIEPELGQRTDSPGSSNGSTTFDDFLKRGGDGMYTLPNSQHEASLDGGLRRRLEGARGRNDAVPPSNPFTDDEEITSQTLFDRSLIGVEGDELQHSRESTATIPAEDASLQNLEPTHPSLSQTDLLMPVRTEDNTPVDPATIPAICSVSEASYSQHPVIELPQPNTDFFSPWNNPTPSPGNRTPSPHSVSAVSDMGSAVDVAGETSGDEGNATHGRDYDVISEFDGLSTPGTWTEVGSEVSEGDLGGR